MFDFNKPKIEITEISDDKKYGRFVVEPLERGYGITLGNSLRRIMLSSLPGAAVSQVKIEGVLHEFSSIPGVKEDVTEIIMNLKSLAIRNNSETNLADLEDRTWQSSQDFQLYNNCISVETALAKVFLWAGCLNFVADF